MFEYLTTHRFIVGAVVVLIILEVLGLYIDFYRERQLEARSEIIAIHLAATLEGNRAPTCAEIERIGALWVTANFEKARPWQMINRTC